MFKKYTALFLSSIFLFSACLGPAEDDSTITMTPGIDELPEGGLYFAAKNSEELMTMLRSVEEQGRTMLLEYVPEAETNMEQWEMMRDIFFTYAEQVQGGVYYLRIDPEWAKNDFESIINTFAAEDEEAIFTILREHVCVYGVVETSSALMQSILDDIQETAESEELKDSITMKEIDNNFMFELDGPGMVPARMIKEGDVYSFMTLACSEEEQQWAMKTYTETDQNILFSVNLEFYRNLFLQGWETIKKEIPPEEFEPEVIEIIEKIYTEMFSLKLLQSYGDMQTFSWQMKVEEDGLATSKKVRFVTEDQVDQYQEYVEALLTAQKMYFTEQVDYSFVIEKSATEVSVQTRYTNMDWSVLVGPAFVRLSKMYGDIIPLMIPFAVIGFVTEAGAQTTPEPPQISEQQAMIIMDLLQTFFADVQQQDLSASYALFGMSFQETVSLEDYNAAFEAFFSEEYDFSTFVPESVNVVSAGVTEEGLYALEGTLEASGQYWVFTMMLEMQEDGTEKPVSFYLNMLESAEQTDSE